MAEIFTKWDESKNTLINLANCNAFVGGDCSHYAKTVNTKWVTIFNDNVTCEKGETKHLGVCVINHPT